MGRPNSFVSSSGTLIGNQDRVVIKTICKHDFGPYPSDRELFYDIAFIVVRLIEIDSQTFQQKDKQTNEEKHTIATNFFF